MTAFSNLILKYGYRGTTTKKIADSAGVNESTIFRHFKDKNGILTMLVTPEIFIEKEPTLVNRHSH